jgi:hypothetical protein
MQLLTFITKVCMFGLARGCLLTLHGETFGILYSVFSFNGYSQLHLIYNPQGAHKSPQHKLQQHTSPVSVLQTHSSPSYTCCDSNKQHQQPLNPVNNRKCKASKAGNASMLWGVLTPLPPPPVLAAACRKPGGDRPL